jgi:hypothetical protein
MLVPFGSFLDLELSGARSTVALALIVAIVIAGSLKYIKDRGIAYKIPIIFIFSGLLWALPMRHFAAFHDFQAIFYIGFAVTWYMALSSHIHPRTLQTVAIVVFLMFVMSVSRMNAEKAAISQTVNEVTTEFTFRKCFRLPVVKRQSHRRGCETEPAQGKGEMPARTDFSPLPLCG